MLDFNPDIRVMRRVAEIGQEQWDFLSQKMPFTSYHWYRFGETVLADDAPTYVTLDWDGEPVARATFWLTRKEPLPIKSSPLRSLARHAFYRAPLFFCRSPLAKAAGLILPADKTLRRAAFEQLTQFGLQMARQSRASFVIFDYLEPALTAPAAFDTYQFSEAETVLQFDGEDFEGYLSRLDKSARKDYHRHGNRARDLGIVIETAAEVSRIDEAVRLIDAVNCKYNSAPHPYTRQILANAGLAQPIWITARMDERLVGCGLVLGDGDVYTLALLGLDYSVNYVYFQLLYEAIRSVLAAGGRVLYGGTGAYEIKQRLGFQANHNNQIVFAASNPVLRYVVHQLAAN
ncbi:MAG TPA: GNAT family N-acetyltransferase [Phototrophicaceae bacterium]|nr:GNAT family N-acetyltransferase [Phototrophicaceae bacterium]